jgi:exopolysaccharide production protein ExoY
LSTQSQHEEADSRLAAPSSQAHLLSRPRLVSTTEKHANGNNGHAGPLEVALEAEAAVLDSEHYASSGGEQCTPITSGPIAAAAIPSLRNVTKRLLDVFGAFLLGIIFAPLMLIIAVLTHRQGASVIYRDRRIGRNGHVFECLKFRTMVPNADQVLRDLLECDPDLKTEWFRHQKLRHDPRVTPVGRFLRRTSLDELPQIWNVLRGEMSLVGPRPAFREQLLLYGRHLSTYLSVKPGITGLWQVTGRANTTFRRRVILDTYYVRNQSFLLDVYILFKTMSVVLVGIGAY